jgi:ABC-type maltose transport system permease subunit
MGFVTTTISGFTGCSATVPLPKLIVTPRNLPASVWLQNAVCNGAGTASITLMTAKTDLNISVPTTSVFQFFLIP